MTSGPSSADQHLLELLRRRDFANARRLLLAQLEHDPKNQLILARLKQVESALAEQMAHGHSMTSQAPEPSRASRLPQARQSGIPAGGGAPGSMTNQADLQAQILAAPLQYAHAYLAANRFGEALQLLRIELSRNPGNRQVRDLALNVARRAYPALWEPPAHAASGATSVASEPVPPSEPAPRVSHDAAQRAEAARLRAEQERRAQEAEAARLRAEQERRAQEAAEAARLRAEQERRAQEAEAARLRAEQERRAQQEAEAARLRAEQERRAQQEAEAARLRAEQERRAQQEAEAARLRAEQERRAQQEAEAARLRAEQERRAQQEAEAALSLGAPEGTAERGHAIQAEHRGPFGKMPRHLVSEDMPTEEALHRLDEILSRVRSRRRDATVRAST